jgi:hypothetical protein
MAVRDVKPIRFEYEGTAYELYFTRATVKRMEKDGFVLSDLKDKSMNTILDLFAGAFQARHRFTKRPEIEKIYDALRKKNKNTKNNDGEDETLIERLIALYNAPYEALLGDDEDDENLIEWS